MKPGEDRVCGGPHGLRSLGHVARNETLGSLVRLTVHVPGWCRARPGQFALLQPEPSTRFLARPLSVCEQAGHDVTFLIAPIGEGTLELCALAVGAPVWVLGPLGNGFDADSLAGSGRRIGIVGGGAGVAPFPLLLADLAERPSIESVPSREPGADGPIQVETLALLGFRDSEQSRAEAVVTEVAAAAAGRMACEVEVAVEDGSRGPAERVTDLLVRRVRSGDQVVVCGPWAMAEAVWRICAQTDRVDAWFSLETLMACGVGSCHGCVVELAGGSYARVCHEGPVFSGREVFGG